MRLRRGIYTPFGVCCGFGQAFRGPVCNPLCGITSLSVPVFPGCHSLLVASYSPGRATPRDTLAFRGVTLSSGAENPGLDVSCTQGSWRPTLVPPPASCGEERHICASRLDCHTVLGGPCTGKHGSFQRDSAGSYRPTQASGFHGWERPNIAGGLSCTAWALPCFWLLHMWRIPSLHAPPGAAALQVSAHSVAVIVPPLPPP